MGLQACFIVEDEQGESVITIFEDVRFNEDENIIEGIEKISSVSPNFMDRHVEKYSNRKGYNIGDYIYKFAKWRGYHYREITEVHIASKTKMDVQYKFLSLDYTDKGIYTKPFDNLLQGKRKYLQDTWIVGEELIKQYFEDNIYLLL